MNLLADRGYLEFSKKEYNSFSKLQEKCVISSPKFNSKWDEFTLKAKSKEHFYCILSDQAFVVMLMEWILSPGGCVLYSGASGAW